MIGQIESLDDKGFAVDAQAFWEKIAFLNKEFRTTVEAKNGFFGETVRVKDNGVVEKVSKDIDGHYHKEYYDPQGNLFQIKESLGDHKVATIDVDAKGNEYSRVVRQSVDQKAKIVDYSLAPNTTIVKGNVVAITDSYGRPILNKVTDLQYNSATNPGGSKFRNASYLEGDHGGHLIPHQFGGSASPENIVAQNGRKVNQGQFAKVEHIVKDLKDQGHTVDYEVKSNYVGSNKRATSFEPKITVDGADYPLPKDLQKIYNDPEIIPMKKAITTIGEVGTAIGDVGKVANDVGIKSGLVAAGLTAAVSTADNLSAFLDGEITAEEMVVDIVKETAAAGASEYGGEFISTAVSKAMSQSSSQLIKRVAGAATPELVTFAVESYDSVAAYARGEIDGEELAYELGENAVTVEAAAVGGKAGAVLGMKIGGAIGTLVGPGGTAVGAAVGGVAGGIVGGVVGAAVASEAYATAMELGAEGAEFLAEKAEGLMEGTLELFEETIPEKWDEAKTAFCEFIDEFELPFSL